MLFKNSFVVFSDKTISRFFIVRAYRHKLTDIQLYIRAANNASHVTCIAKRFYCLIPQLAANSAQMKETDQVADEV